MEISWYLKGRVVLAVAPPHNNHDEVLEGDAELVELLNQAEAHWVHLILDDTGVITMPGIGTFSKMKALKHPALGWTVIVGLNNKTFRMINAIIAQLFRLRLHMADTIEEATKFLNDLDSSLPPLQPQPETQENPTELKSPSLGLPE